MTEQELARRCVARDPAAWAEFVREHADLVFRAVRLALRTAPEADVEDVVQSVFLKLWEDGCRRLASFQGRSRLSTWLVVVARREALAFAERKRMVPLDPVPEIAALELAEPKDLERVRELLERLPARDRLLLRLIYFDGASYADAARLLQAPENSISPWLSRARERLKSLLGGRP